MNVAVSASVMMTIGPQVCRSLKRIRGKQPAPPERLLVSSYTEAWRHYIRGNVVSQHACRHSEGYHRSSCRHGLEDQ